MHLITFLYTQNGAIRGTLLALQFLGKDKGGQGGIVVNIGSASSARPQISTPIYTATKHAVLGLSRSCGVCFWMRCLNSGSFKIRFSLQDAYHYNLTGVRVIALCPSFIDNGTSSTSLSNRFKSPVHEKAWQLDMKGIVPQK